MLMGTSILEWITERLAKESRRDETLYIAQPQWPNGSISGPLIHPEKLEPDVTLRSQPVEEKIMENEWYKEEWATDLMGTIASVVFKQPAEAPVVSPQAPAKTTDLGAKIEFGDWTIVVTIISIVALILVFLFLKKGRGAAY